MEEVGDGGSRMAAQRTQGTELTAPSYLASCLLFLPPTDLFVLAKVFVLRARLGFFSLAYEIAKAFLNTSF